MQLDRYELKAEDSLMVFEFLSEGYNGKIPKIIIYTETALHGFYNLAFGHKDAITGGVNDTSISNNGDSEKVLATVVSSLYSFTNQYGGVYIYATGSTKSRTRLYRMGIGKYLEMITADFDVYALHKGEWHSFRKDWDFEAFVAKRKTL